MIEVSSSVVIDRPAAEVLEFVADAENNPRWQRGMRSCRWLSAHPVHVGATYRHRSVRGDCKRLRRLLGERP